MLQYSRTSHRYRTAWRELLHPLPVDARKMEWLKRDIVEMNESTLRRPYYTIKSYALPSAVLNSNNSNCNGKQMQEQQKCRLSCSGVEEILRRQRHVRSVEQLHKLRDQLQFPNAIGPNNINNNITGKVGESYSDTYGTRLRPRYPESWDTVPPHQPSRGML
ncbi:hypothetical protein LSM04_007068 [Trypanosoma melophagium]|uniref:uncharacterized protein n=1 Tax=Trypanosoma melophagium TaxID=715481 RepID=UPI00351AA1DD|nr:hypothetical protein LSM04_007068 [Trypanosoma melophagium]